MRVNRASISLRLTFWFGCIFFSGWVLFGAAMWFNLKSTLTGERYTTLSRRLDRLQNLLQATQKEVPADKVQDYTDFAHATGNGLAEVFRADGSRAYPSPSPAAADFPWPAVPAKPGEQFVHAQAEDQPYWVLVRPFTLGTEQLYLFVAAPEAGNLIVLEQFWKGLLASAPLLLLISSVGGYWLSRRALKPVDRITATARSISIRNLSERVPEVKTGDELQRLVETCNAMLARLESAVNQIRQFTADASHELRGPLSFVRTVAEVALRNPHADQQSRQSFEEIVAEMAKAAVLLEEMLTLARADAGSSDAVLEQQNLAEVIQAACEIARPIAIERSLTLSVAVEEEKPVIVLGDFSALRRLLWILLDNALKFTQPHGEIEVALHTTGERATVVVRDNGAGIPEEALPHIFDRFYRADPSRSQVEGTGLGLAIARWIADLHHADLTIASQVQKGTVVRLALPVYAGKSTVA
ncbi:sensor histidine kinase [Paracidobacterium acidisoli]|uniref:histidine kinase n=1 Tax=Paracidobacterium acidisoli TaxID=2303751 RepID=A0A372IUQ4_9BACT|nr:ATP-binding protein [Paracidobacterium acidisoli]MBT9329572.1 HAMP domain-containing protein [Paracidobacterium acidisoli]